MAVAPEEIDPGIGGPAPEDRVGTALRPDAAAAKLWRRGRGCARPAPNDPATLLITDFSREDAWTVQAEHSIDQALLHMTCAGVDALLVERSEAVIGLVTAHDVQGPRSLELLQSCGCAARGATRVADVMAPWGRVPVLEWRSIAASRVRHLEEWARNTRDTHALLVQQLDGLDYVRGLISRAFVGRSLGCPL